MFETIEQPRRWPALLLHFALAVFLTPLIGLLNYWLAPVVGAFIGVLATGRMPDRVVIFAWLPGLALFLLAAMGTRRHGMPPGPI